MANEQGNTTDNEDQGSPFARPTFIGAAVLVLVIVLLGVVLAVRVARSDDTDTPPPTSTAPQTTSESASSPPTYPIASVCGLAASADTGLTSPPAATWGYEGTTAYPRSPEFGPGETAPESYRYCYQHSPAGAVFATANALALPEAERARNAWIEYFVSTGPNRQKLLDTFQEEPTSTPTGMRLRIVGFKVLSYESSAARVDIAIEAAGSGQTVTGSYVYELTWQAGDWKLNSDAPTPFNFSTVPSAAGYIPWSE